MSAEYFLMIQKYNLFARSLGFSLDAISPSRAPFCFSASMHHAFVGIWLIASMNTFVVVQMVLSEERFFAVQLIAMERTLSCVNFFMKIIIGKNAECLFTAIALMMISIAQFFLVWTHNQAHFIAKIL